jgi:hypothetical protein
MYLAGKGLSTARHILKAPYAGPLVFPLRLQRFWILLGHHFRWEHLMNFTLPVTVPLGAPAAPGTTVALPAAAFDCVPNRRATEPHFLLSPLGLLLSVLVNAGILALLVWLDPFSPYFLKF